MGTCKNKVSALAEIILDPDHFAQNFALSRMRHSKNLCAQQPFDIVGVIYDRSTARHIDERENPRMRENYDLAPEYRFPTRS